MFVLYWVVITSSLDFLMWRMIPLAFISSTPLTRSILSYVTLRATDFFPAIPASSVTLGKGP